MTSTDENNEIGSHEDNNDNNSHDFSLEEEEEDDTTEDLQSMMATFFMEEKKNRNIVHVLLEIKRTLETHNRIMLNLFNHLTHTHTNN